MHMEAKTVNPNPKITTHDHDHHSRPTTTTHDRRPTTDDRRPTTDYRRPRRRPTTDDRPRPTRPTTHWSWLWVLGRGSWVAGRGSWSWVVLVCSADGSTHTESNKLYRKVKHRSPPKSFLTPTAKARPVRRRSRRLQGRRAPHTEHGLGVLLAFTRASSTDSTRSTHFTLTQRHR